MKETEKGIKFFTSTKNVVVFGQQKTVKKVVYNSEKDYIIGENILEMMETSWGIYRTEDEPSGGIAAASTPHALPKALSNDFPDLENVVSILSTRDEEIKTSDNTFQERIIFASPDFFDMFDFPFVVGSKKQLAENINSIILSKRLAKKLFGDVSPLGKQVIVHGQIPFIVAGIIANIPTNSSFQFDAFVSNDIVYRYIMPGEDQKWYAMGVETFVEFNENLSPNMLKAQLTQFLQKYLPDYLQGRIELKLQPLRDIHTNTEISSYAFPAVSKKMLLIFFLVACFILGIACIPELAWGMRKCMKYDIPVVGLPLNANRCRRWWGKFYHNSVDLEALQKLVAI